MNEPNHPCPVCASREYRPFLDEPALRREEALRARFVRERLERMLAPAERKDLTDFAHDAPAALLECCGCGLLWRSERRDPEQTYVEDPYDFAMVERMLPRYLEAFRAKEAPYRSLLPEGSRVLEIGPHFGAFLQVATEWGWRPEGVDIGKDTSAYLAGKGYAIHTRPVEECGFEPGSFDGVFMWNCFEQIADPGASLAACRGALRSGGLLLLRTPNALLYKACQPLLQDGELGAAGEAAAVALGYENLLGFPYLYGYDSGLLKRIGGAHGFEPAAEADAELIILPFPETPGWMIEERRSIAAAVRMAPALRSMSADGRLTGSWIEVTFRAAKENA